MGAWGTGISSNDTYADVYDQFFDLYNDGVSVSDISAKLIGENQETIEMYEDAPNFWYALAKVQWECKELSEDVRLRVEHFVHSGEDLQIWRDLGATAADIKAREKALAKFLTRLRSEKPSAKNRKKKKYYDSVFNKGDCLVYRMDNGNYGGAFVLTDEKSTEVGTNHIAITTIDKPEKPTLKDFKNGEVYVRYGEQLSFRGTELLKQWIDQPQIGGFSALSFDRAADFEIEVIGNIPIFKEYKPPRIVVFGWITLKMLLPLDDKYVAANGRPKSTLYLTEWTTKSSKFPFLRWFQ